MSVMGEVTTTILTSSSAMNMLDGCLNISPDEGSLQFTLLAEFNMPNRLARTFQDSVGVSEQRTPVEPEVHVAAVGHNVAEAILERLACERESNRDRIALHYRFDGFGCFFQNDVAKCQS